MSSTAPAKMLGGAPFRDSRIESVDVFQLSAPIPPAKQHVSDFGKVSTFDTVFVRITTESGLEGWGEAKNAAGSTGRYGGLAAILREDIVPLLPGRSARDIQSIWELVYNGVRAGHANRAGRVFPELSRRGVTIAALSAVDIALWDLLGKSLQAPVWQLLGGRRKERFPAYASGGWADVDGIGEELTGYIEKGGFSSVKMRVGALDGSPELSARRVKAARAALGPDVQIFCDAHGTFSVSEAKRFCRMVTSENIGWLEEPVTGDNKRGMAEVRCFTDIPIAAGESEFTRFDFRDLLDLRCVDILQPDMAVCGGISEGVRIAALAAAYDVPLAPHLWTGALGFMSGLHVLASSPTGWIVEYSLGANPVLHDVIEESIQPVEGCIPVPDRVGLGVTINTDALKRFVSRENQS